MLRHPPSGMFMPSWLRAKAEIIAGRLVRLSDRAPERLEIEVLLLGGAGRPSGGSVFIRVFIRKHI